MMFGFKRKRKIDPNLCKCCKAKLDYQVLDVIDVGVGRGIEAEYIIKCLCCGAIKEHWVMGTFHVYDYKTPKMPKVKKRRRVPKELHDDNELPFY